MVSSSAPWCVVLPARFTFPVLLSFVFADVFLIDCEQSRFTFSRVSLDFTMLNGQPFGEHCLSLTRWVITTATV